MAVERFRSIGEMNAAPVRSVSDDGFERFVRHCARFRSTTPRFRPRGVFLFRSLDEAERARPSRQRALTRFPQTDGERAKGS